MALYRMIQLLQPCPVQIANPERKSTKTSRNVIIQISTNFTQSLFRNLDYSDSVGNIQCIVILRQLDVAFLQTSRSNESVYFLAFNFVKILNGRLDLTFVGLNIDDENQCVAVFNQLHRRFCCQRILDNTELVNSALLRDAGSCILGLSRVLKGFGFVEVNFGVNTSSLLGNSLVQRL